MKGHLPHLVKARASQLPSELEWRHDAHVGPRPPGATGDCARLWRGQKLHQREPRELVARVPGVRIAPEEQPTGTEGAPDPPERRGAVVALHDVAQAVVLNSRLERGIGCLERLGTRLLEPHVE